MIPLFLPALIAPAPQQAPLETGKSRFVLLEKGATVLLPLRLSAGEHNLRIVAARLANRGDIALQATLKSATGQELERVQFFDNTTQSTERITLSPTLPRNPTLELAQAAPGEKVLLKIYLDTEDEPEEPAFSFSPARPKVTVLVHGITSEPLQAPEEGIGTSKHPRWYWGFDFLKALVGAPTAELADVTQVRRGSASLERRPIDRASWKTENRNLAPQSSDLATVFSVGSLGYPGAVDGPTQTVMVSFRDGSKHLMPQVAATIDQVYETYQAVYGKLPTERQPQIYFVAHSFGGVVCRAIFSNPSGPDLFGNRLTAQQRERADFLRARTVLLATLSTPHEGSPIPDQAQDIAAYLRRTGKSLESVLTPLDQLTDFPLLKKLDLATSLVGTARSGLASALAMVSGERDSLKDIQRMAEYNQGILAPAKAQRPDGTLIPIYTMGGRNPGGLYFDRTRSPVFVKGRLLPYDFTDVFGAGRLGKEAAQLYLIQGFLHHAGYGKEGKKPWGTARIPDADLYASPYEGRGRNPARTQSAALEITRELTAAVLHDFLVSAPYTNGRDGETDSDGFVGFDSSHGLGLSGGAWYRVYGDSRYGQGLPWDRDNHGSLMFNLGNALWIHNELLLQSGPQPGQGLWSHFTGQSTTAARPAHRITVEVLEIKDVDDSLDTVTDADFTAFVRIAGRSLRRLDCSDNTQTVTKVFAMNETELPQSVIPVSFSVIERDDSVLGDLLDPDDLCTISPNAGRDNVHVYFDTRTQRIYGDVSGAAGATLTVTGRDGVRNRVQLKFRITGN